MKKRNIAILLVALALIALGAIEIFLYFVSCRILEANEQIVSAVYVDCVLEDKLVEGNAPQHSFEEVITKTELPESEARKIQPLLQGRRGWVPFLYGIDVPGYPFIELKTSLGRVIEIHPYTPRGREFFIIPHDVYIHEPEFKDYLKEYYENLFRPIETTTP